MSENAGPQLTEADAERMTQMHRARLTLDEIARIDSLTLRTPMPPAEQAALGGRDQR